MLPSADAQFNYAALPAEKAASARAAAEQVRTLVSLAVANIIEAGKVCNNQKDALGHGHFKAWVSAELDVSYETVVNWMRVAKEFGDKNVNLTFLKPSTLYALAAPSTPEPVRTEVLERAANGEKVTAREIDALKRRLLAAEGKIAEKEAQRVAQENRANIAAKQVSDATNRAMFAEADKDRLAAELEDMREEVERMKEPGVITLFNEHHVAPVSEPTPWTEEDTKLLALKSMWGQASPQAQRLFMEWLQTSECAA
ncbi:DUF3102 domain-containing protein [Rhizobium pusense]|uniref:DUF3102 domain-containing protein n=1 Tax=Agrobacterium pusense TaxID=648995 RepID=UPI002449D4FE|nr:DUF3102 domain-containing protein [Agrobacterium pusense]MDH2091084.1 DUF3102 domain-containing protein [Agrobacterium pusense]